MRLLEATRAYEIRVGPPMTKRVQRTQVLLTAAKAFWTELWPTLARERLRIAKVGPVVVTISVARLEGLFVSIFGPKPTEEPDAPTPAAPPVDARASVARAGRLQHPLG